jgi:hypothetical protein
MQAERCYQEGLDTILQLKSLSSHVFNLDASAANTPLLDGEMDIDTPAHQSNATNTKNDAYHLRLAQLQCESQFFANQVAKLKQYALACSSA